MELKSDKEPLPGHDWASTETYMDWISDEHSCRLRGTAREVKKQVSFLEKRGHKIYGPKDPSLLEYNKFEAAIRDLWEAKVAGWQAYKDYLLQHRICSEKELIAASA